MANEFDDNQCIQNQFTDTECGGTHDIRPGGVDGSAGDGIYGGVDGTETVDLDRIEWMRNLPCGKFDMKGLRTLFHFIFRRLDEQCDQTLVYVQDLHGSNVFWSGDAQHNVYSGTFERKFANSRVMVLANFDSMIEAEVGPPGSDNAISNSFEMNIGDGFVSIGRNFLNSAITGGDTSDSVSEQTHVGFTGLTSGSGNVPITIRSNPNLSQGSNLRGDERNISIAVIETSL